MGDAECQRKDTLPVFYAWPRELAQTLLIRILSAHLPHSNPVYNRILAPHNTPAQHCLYGATFPQGTEHVPAVFTVLFSDRSRHQEAQIWLFNPLSAKPRLQPAETDLLNSNVASAVNFLRATKIPDAPGWPFLPVLKFACLPTVVADALVKLTPNDAIQMDTNWTHYLIPLERRETVPELPAGFSSASPVPHDQLDIVIATSTIPRQKETLKGLPSVGLLDHEGKLVAWAFVSVDASLATLFVIPEHRKKGFARIVAGLLLEKLHKGEFKFTISGRESRQGSDEAPRPFGISSQWIHTEVKEGNVGSERVVESLGGRKSGFSRYTFVDGDQMPTF